MISPVRKSSLRQSLRNHVRLQRRALTPQEQTAAALRVVSRVMNNARIQSAFTLSLFLPFDGELNTQPLIDALWRAGKQVYLPVLHPFTSGHLLFLHYTAATPLVVNRMRIHEPRLDITTLLPLIELDILFTPLVAFNEQGQRIGMGGGFYDRILQYWCPQSGFYPIGLAHDCQRVAELLPVEEWDIALPEVITPSQHWCWPVA